MQAEEIKFDNVTPAELITSNTLWYQKATYTNIFLKKKLRTVKFETTVETNNKSISRQTTMVFDYLNQTILIR